MDLRDPVSSVSHLGTAVWAVFATLILMRLTRGGAHRRLAVLVYGLSMVLLYTASGVFHGLNYENEQQKRFFQLIDQTAIFGLIAGTCTPMIVMLLSGPLRRWSLVVVWGLTFVAAACLWLLPKPPHEVIVGLCLALGWFNAVPMIWYYRALGWRAMNLVWLGAGLYSAGGIFELLEWPVIWPPWIGFHELLHFCDTAATLVFFVFITRYVIPYRRPASGIAQSEPVVTHSYAER